MNSDPACDSLASLAPLLGKTHSRFQYCCATKDYMYRKPRGSARSFGFLSELVLLESNFFLTGISSMLVGSVHQSPSECSLQTRSNYMYCSTVKCQILTTIGIDKYIYFGGVWNGFGSDKYIYRVVDLASLVLYRYRTRYGRRGLRQHAVRAAPARRARTGTSKRADQYKAELRVAHRSVQQLLAAAYCAQRTSPERS